MTEGQVAAREWRMLPAEQVRTLARQLIDVEPMLHQAEAAQILARLGWRPGADGGRIRSVMLVDSGLGLTGYPGKLWLDREDRSRVASISAAVCDNVTPPTPAAAPFLRDAFALATRALAESFGPPTQAESGEDPEVSWRMEVLTLTLRASPTTVTLVLERNSDLDLAAEMSAYEQ